MRTMSPAATRDLATLIRITPTGLAQRLTFLGLTEQEQRELARVAS